ncbi:MAG: hypothetical protein BM560_15640 [Roseobacter sp. MedPE-SWde]|nr:MAG: hypothetical protein BM560_15640 [Roseobacter sp. MedPE-SWde]
MAQADLYFSPGSLLISGCTATVRRDAAAARAERAAGPNSQGAYFMPPVLAGAPPFYCRWFPQVFALKCCPGPCLIAPAAHHRYPSLKGERFHDKPPLGPLGHRF